MWYDDEFADIALGDQRRNRRCLRLIGAWWTHLGGSMARISQGWHEQMAAYRLFASSRMTRAAVLAPHRRCTVTRVQQEAVVLLAQDTTELDYAGKPIARTPGAVGPLNTERRVGLLAHVQYAVTPARLPLGVLDVRLGKREALRDKARTRAHKTQAFAEKESYRWYRGYRLACALQRLAPQTQIVSVADREGDIYEVLAAAQAPRGTAAYLIRACQDRAVVVGSERRTQSLRLGLRLSPVLGAATLTVPAGPGRMARTAHLTVHAQPVTCRPPYRPTGKLPQITVHAVLVREVAPPAGEPPIEWVLLTSLPIDTLLAVQRIIRYYACRWEIEVFFRLWKSGCQVETMQWQTRDRLDPALALCAVLAWRLHLLGRLGEADPAQPCTVFCATEEWHVTAWLATSQRPATPPSVATLIRWIAKLGGFAGRRSDGPPGPLVLMRGWLTVQQNLRLYRLMATEEKCV